MKELLDLIKHLNVKGLLLTPTTNGLIQFFRYAFVGGIATMFDWGLLYILTEFCKLHYLVSGAVSFAMGLCVNFVLSKLLVFKENEAKVGRILEFVSYAIIGLVGLAFTELIMYMLTNCLRLFYMLSKLIATFIVLLWNYFARKKVLYKS